jgi:predicted permease
LSLFVTTFESIAVLLVIGCVGFYIINRKVLSESAFSLLSPLSLDIALPCLVFVNILTNFKPAENPDWWMLPLWWVGFTIVAGFLAAFFSLLAKKEIRKEFTVSLFYQNGIFFPLAILTGIYGGDSFHIVNLFIFVMFFPSLLFSTCHLFWKNPDRPVRWNRIFNTMIIVTVVATFIRLMDFQVYIPSFLLNGLRMVGGMTVPLLMIIIGGNIYIDFKNKGKLLIPEITSFLIIKNVIYPLVALFILYLLRPPYYIALLIIIQSAVPPVTAIPVVVENEGGRRDVVNQFLFTSALFALFSIPFIMYLFGLLYPDG